MDAPGEPEAVQTIPESDPFDIGDEAVTPASSRPRNPDGTFAKVPTDESPEPAPAGEPAVKPPVTSGYRQRLEAEAVEMGFSEHEISDLSDTALSTSINKLLRQQAAFQQQLLKERTLQESEVRKPNPHQLEEDDVDLGIPQEELAEFDPRLVNALKSVAKKNGAETKQLKERLAKAEEREQVRTQAHAADLIDSAFEGMGEKWEKFFGKGPGRDMGEEQKSHFKRRVALLRSAGLDLSNLPSSRALQAKLLEEAETLYGPAMEAAPKPSEENVYAQPAANGNGAKPRISKEDWDSATVARPTSRRSPEMPDGDEKAVKNMAEKMRQQQAADVKPDSLELEGFL